MKQRSGWAGGGPIARATGGRVMGPGAYADGGDVEGEAPMARLDRPGRVSVAIGAPPPQAVPVPVQQPVRPANLPSAMPGAQVIPPMGGTPMSPQNEMQRPMAHGGRVKHHAKPPRPKPQFVPGGADGMAPPPAAPPPTDGGMPFASGGKVVSAKGGAGGGMHRLEEQREGKN